MSGLEPNEKLSKRLQVGFTDHGPSVLPITRPSPSTTSKPGVLAQLASRFASGSQERTKLFHIQKNGKWQQ